MGFVSAIGAIILTFRQMNTRPNIAMGFEFECIIMAVMGGVSIMGGKGKMIGVVLGIYFVGLSRNVLYILNVPSETMRIIIGAMLIFAILIPELMANRKKKLLTLQDYKRDGK
jgi:rhamnose transport system permease protein